MRSPLPFRLIAAALLSFLVLISAARAGGALTQAEFLDEIADPQLREFIAEHFELAGEGRAVRSGPSEPNAGERLPPFEIVARDPTAGHAPLVLRLEAHRSRSVVLSTCEGSRHYSPDCE